VAAVMKAVTRKVAGTGFNGSNIIRVAGE